MLLKSWHQITSSLISDKRCAVTTTVCWSAGSTTLSFVRICQIYPTSWPWSSSQSKTSSTPSKRQWFPKRRVHARKILIQAGATNNATFFSMQTCSSLSCKIRVIAHPIRAWLKNASKSLLIRTLVSYKNVRNRWIDDLGKKERSIPWATVIKTNTDFK